MRAQTAAAFGAAEGHGEMDCSGTHMKALRQGAVEWAGSKPRLSEASILTLGDQDPLFRAKIQV